jgi:hypothetical protein
MIYFLPRCAAIVITSTAVVLLCATAAHSADERECHVPERFYSFEPPLSKTAKAIVAGRPAVIVALGGASTLGIAAGSIERAWPARMSAALETKFRPARAKVVNLAVARQTAKTAIERLEREVFPLKPTLIIWETGTMEAVRAMQVDEFRKTMQTGITEILGTGAELVMMNMQFSRDSGAIIDFQPYVAAMREVADADEVPLFRRYGIMRYWAESGALDLETRDTDKRRYVAAKLYDCIGRAMADFVTRGVSAPPAK